MMKVKYVAIKAKEYALGVCGLVSSNILLNYCIENNAGDSFNKFFLEDYLGLKLGKYTFGAKEHYLFCGSVLGRANKFSLVIGAGFISSEQAESGVEVGTVLGVRGELSLSSLRDRYPDIEPKFIGDPGLLAREVFRGTSEVSVDKKIGVIPHFIDFSLTKSLLGQDEEYKLIDIRRPFYEVCCDIRSCSSVLSSSLHGLIFSDAMNIPNSWIKLSGNIKGGDFKFRDYYSAMSNPEKYCHDCKNLEDFLIAVKDSSVSENPYYENMRTVIYDTFSCPSSARSVGSRR